MQSLPAFNAACHTPNSYGRSHSCLDGHCVLVQSDVEVEASDSSAQTAAPVDAYCGHGQGTKGELN